MRRVFPFLLLAACGSALSAQSIGEVRPSAARRSDRVVIIGSGFGAVQGDSTVLIGGRPAVVSAWSHDRIRAHVPEGSPLGSVEVQVLTDGPSNAGGLDVLPREGRDGRVLWRVQLDHYYSLARPAVGPDGTVYATGIGGPLYAVSPRGEVKWAVQNAGGSRPASVGADGTVYTTGSAGAVMAISPAGGVVWGYTPPSNAGGVFVGPNVGPDGKIYAVTKEEPSLGTDFGAFALEPDGTLAWSRSGAFNHRRIAYGWEIVFAEGQAHFATGQGDPSFGDHGVHALDMATGTPRWTLAGRGDLQRDAAGNLYWLGAINNNYIGSYAPDGDERWTIAYNQFLGQPGSYVVAATGESYYCTSTMTTLAAIEPDGWIRWQQRDFYHLLALQGVTPDGERFFGMASPTDNSAPKMRVWSGADGAVLWEHDVPQDAGVWMFPQWEGVVTDDGRTLYFTLAGNNSAEDPYSYLYAIDMSESGACAGDFDGSGGTNTLDVLAFLNAWNARDPEADFNADGAINTLDVLAFLNAWSAGC